MWSKHGLGATGRRAAAPREQPRPPRQGTGRGRGQNKGSGLRPLPVTPNPCPHGPPWHPPHAPIDLGDPRKRPRRPRVQIRPLLCVSQLSHVFTREPCGAHRRAAGTALATPAPRSQVTAVGAGCHDFTGEVFWGDFSHASASCACVCDARSQAPEQLLSSPAAHAVSNPRPLHSCVPTRWPEGFSSPGCPVSLAGRRSGGFFLVGRVVNGIAAAVTFSQLVFNIRNFFCHLIIQICRILTWFNSQRSKGTCAPSLSPHRCRGFPALVSGRFGGVFLLRHHLYGTESALSSQVPLRGLPGPPQAAGPPRTLGPGPLQPLGVHVLDPVSSSAWGRRAVAPPGTAERVALPAPRCACPGQSRPPPRGPPRFAGLALGPRCGVRGCSPRAPAAGTHLSRGEAARPSPSALPSAPPR